MFTQLRKSTTEEVRTSVYSYRIRESRGEVGEAEKISRWNLPKSLSREDVYSQFRSLWIYKITNFATSSRLPPVPNETPCFGFAFFKKSDIKKFPLLFHLKPATHFIRTKRPRLSIFYLYSINCN